MHGMHATGLRSEVRLETVCLRGAVILGHSEKSSFPSPSTSPIPARISLSRVANLSGFGGVQSL
jgi:hypothetical protein